MMEQLDALTFLAQIPNPPPAQPPGAEKIVAILANVKWGAGFALVFGFFIGLLVWAGGRWADNHRAGRVGLIMMICALAGGVLYAIGWQLISSFAGTQ